ncbi:MAG: TetR/AcrR family transcriptional regulator [Eubacterium sp.]|nr:TetR/AcrR family transcriptional regulator [Candidatus Colimonas fimequi]
MANQRVRLTKKLLKTALIELLGEKSIDKITIYELCKRAEINRTTFYKYYGSQQDLFNEIQDDFCDELEAKLNPGDESSLEDLLKYIDGQRELCKVLITQMTASSFLDRVKEIQNLQDALNDDVFNSNETWQNETLKMFILEGAYAVIRSWIWDENPVTPKELADKLVELIVKTLR